MRNPVILVIARIIQTIEFWMIRMHVMRPKVVVYVDGGLCAQMIAYLRGQYYAESGLSVYYDLTFYNNWAKDMDGRFDRPFELLILYPKLQIHVASKGRTIFWRKIFKIPYQNNLLPDRETLKCSRYLYGFPDFVSDEWLQGAFRNIFAINQAVNITCNLSKEEGLTDCAVHVRRGDLATQKRAALYKTVPVEYFYNAIRYAQKKYGQVKFHFFSDEIEWVRVNICPYINASYELVSGHNGYEDLMLIENCPVIIASQGSFGRIASVLNEESELIVPELDNCGYMAVERLKRVTYISIN